MLIRTPTRSRTRRSGAAVAHFLALTMLFTAACSSDGGRSTASKRSVRSTTSTRSAAAPTPRDEAIEAEIESEGVTVDRARALYVAVVGPLPGVVDPPGPASTSMSGTRALGRILSVWEQLTAEQQQAALARMGVGVTDSSVTEVLPVDDPPDPVASAAGGSTTTARGRSVVSHRRRNARSAPPPPASYFDPYVQWANHAISSRVGSPQIPLIRIHVDPDTTPGAAADTTYFDHETTLDACLITLYPGRVTQFDGATIASVISHEVFHCYQEREVGSLASVLGVAGWLLDGEATWVMMELVPSAVYDRLQAKWAQYITTPQHRPLFTRTYDAVGFYGHIEDMEGAGQIWPRLLPAYVAGLAGANEVAFGTLVQGFEDRVMDYWGASYWRAFPNLVIWNMLGPGAGNMPTFGAAPEPVSVGVSQVVSLPTVDPYENLPVRIVASADIVEIVNGRGHLAVASDHGVNDVIATGSSVFYCLKDEPCVCPAGSTGNPPASVRAGGGLSVGLTGARTGSQSQARGYRLDDYCKKPPKKPGKPPKGGGGGGGPPPTEDPPGGRMYADPHLRTFDGRGYDLQAVGEFTLARSTVDDFTVQVRTAPLFPSAAATNAVAVATKVGADRVTLAMSETDPAKTDRHIVLRVNGTEATSTPELAAGSVRRVRGVNGETFDINYPDGSALRVRLGAALDVTVAPADSRKGTLTGLLGNFNGVSADDPTIGADGPALSAAPSFDEVYQQLAPAWRLTQPESLFDYGPGQATATFTDTAFPDRTLHASDQAIADAKSYCKVIGITDEGLFDDCVFDESNTHDHRTAFAYQEQQRFLAWSGTSTSSAGPAREFEGQVSSTDDRPAYTFSAKRGDILDIGGDSPGCHSDPHLAASLEGPEGEPLGVAGDVCAFGRVEVKAAGKYTLTMNSLGEGDSGGWTFQVTPVRADRLSDATAGTALRGSIAMRAEHDVWRFQGQGGQKVSTSGAGCAGPVGVHLVDPDGKLEAPFGSLCDLDSVVLHSSGAYELVVNADNNHTGDYHTTLTVG